MTGTASRLITLIMLLQRRPNQKAAELADHLGVSVRTVHRYMSMLDEMGIPVYSERGPAGGFSLVRGYKMPPLVFHPEEAVAVYLGTNLVAEVWGTLYREAAQGALAKLDNVLPDEQRREIAWAQRTLKTTGLHRAQGQALGPILETLRQAARQRRRTHLIYRGIHRQQETERLFDPFALVHRWGWWYAVGYCHLRSDFRSFRVDRMASLSLLDEAFDPQPGFDLQRYLETEFESQPQIRSRLRFTPETRYIAEDNAFLWESSEVDTDGFLQVSLKTPDLKWGASLALSFGPGVEVLEPAALRDMVAEWAAATAAIYSSSKER